MWDTTPKGSSERNQANPSNNGTFQDANQSEESDGRTN